MQPEKDELRERLRRVAAVRDLVDDVDFSDPLTVDRLCEPLLRWFYASPVPSDAREEAFALLVETSADVLDDAVLGVRRRAGLAVPSADLVDAFFAEFYLGVGVPRLAEKAFVGAAVQRIELIAREAVAMLAGENVQSTAGLVVAENLGGMAGLGDDELERLEAELLDVYCRAFHSLDLRDRQILVCRYIDDLSDVEIVDELGVEILGLDVTCEQALERFRKRKDDLLDDERGASP